MALTEYNHKRKFSHTPEPTGGKSNSARLRFVIQKHDASHLHYDFRLEMRGVLKSWAVPKGPSLDPKVSRLAMMVEDHPYDYRTFEGIIPPGNYGAGSVIIWDEGFYEPTKKLSSKREEEKYILSSLYKGELKFTLHGKKLKGKFILIKVPQRGETSWLLKKVKDGYATDKDISLKSKSVVSGLTVEQMALNKNAKKWISNRSSEDKTNDQADAGNESKGIDEKVKHGKKSAFPLVVKPMLATKIIKPFNDHDWLYEVKWDGYRIIAHIKKQKVILHSRAAQNYTKQYDIIAEELKKLSHDVVIDGEIVVLDNEGRPDFDALQKYDGSQAIVYYVFDILWCDGYDLTALPLIERKDLLCEILIHSELIKFSEHFDDGLALYELINRRSMEGIIAKLRASEYAGGKRSKWWLKIATAIHQEFVIGGWAESESGRPFRTLLFGNYVNGKLHWVGHAGGGFKDKEMPSILKKLQKLETVKKPFVNKVETDTKAHWIKPQLVAEIKFDTWTKSKKIRKPAIFLGFRDDKKATDVVPESVLTSQPISPPSETKLEKSENDTEVTSGSNWTFIEKEKITSEEVFSIGKYRVTLTNVEQELWKGITKADLIQYYHGISKYILPHLKNRPQSIHIKNQGPFRPGFYIKDMEGHQPPWAQVFNVKRKHKKQGKRDVIDYLVCQDEATLLYLINLGCIDINPWTSRIKNYLQPDYIVIDLDPSDDDFSKAIETAQASKTFFDKHKLKTYVKTSGKTGIHIYIPCMGFSFPQARSVAETICHEIHSMVPEITTTEVTISKRGSKLYIDPNQNDEADTVAAPYSVRPSHSPTVSTPLEWKEVNEKLDFHDFTISTMVSRLKKKGELFKDVLSDKIAAGNSKILKKFLEFAGAMLVLVLLDFY